MEENFKTPKWIWADLDDWKSIKQTEKAIEQKGTALTKWSKNEVENKLADKLKELAVRLRPALKLTVQNDGGEVLLLADGV